VSAPAASVDGKVDTKAVRAWAETNGVKVNARGRLSRAVLDGYRAANG